MRMEAQLEGSQLRYKAEDKALASACQSIGLPELEVQHTLEMERSERGIALIHGSTEVMTTGF